jgi:hypothetical protein
MPKLLLGFLLKRFRFALTGADFSTVNESNREASSRLIGRRCNKSERPGYVIPARNCSRYAASSGPRLRTDLSFIRKPSWAELCHWRNTLLLRHLALRATAFANGRGNLVRMQLILTTIDRLAKGIHRALANLRRT